MEPVSPPPPPSSWLLLLFDKSICRKAVAFEQCATTSGSCFTAPTLPSTGIECDVDGEDADVSEMVINEGCKFASLVQMLRSGGANGSVVSAAAAIVKEFEEQAVKCWLKPATKLELADFEIMLLLFVRVCVI